MKALRVLLYNGESKYFTSGSVKLYDINAFIIEDSEHRVLFVAPWSSILYAEVVNIPENSEVEACTLRR